MDSLQQKEAEKPKTCYTVIGDGEEVVMGITFIKHLIHFTGQKFYMTAVKATMTKTATAIINTICNIQ